MVGVARVMLVKSMCILELITVDLQAGPIFYPSAPWRMSLAMASGC